MVKSDQQERQTMTTIAKAHQRELKAWKRAEKLDTAREQQKRKRTHKEAEYELNVAIQRVRDNKVAFIKIKNRWEAARKAQKKNAKATISHLKANNASGEKITAAKVAAKEAAQKHDAYVKSETVRIKELISNIKIESKVDRSIARESLSVPSKVVNAVPDWLAVRVPSLTW
jgi:hypothetical protein